MEGWARRRSGEALVLAACGLWAPAAWSQTASVRPPDLPVTRLEGAGGAERNGAGQQPIQRPGDLSSLPVTNLDDRAADLDGSRRISLTISRPLPLRDVLELLLTGTPLSFVFEEGVDGTFSGALTNLSMRQALEAVLFPRGLDYDVQGSLRPSLSAQGGDAAVRRELPELPADLAAHGAKRDGPVEPARHGSGADDHDRVRPVRRAGQGRAGAALRVGAHARRSHGRRSSRSPTSRIASTRSASTSRRCSCAPPVRCGSRRACFEVTLADAEASSIDWKAVAARSGSTVRAASGRAVGMRIDNFDALKKALAEQGTLTMIAAPHVVAMNNEPAVMRAGTQGVYFTTASQLDQAGRRDRTSTPVAILEGLTLTVTAQIASDGIVQLSVAPTYTEKTGQSKSAAGDVVPVLQVSETDTLVRVQDGDTVVISGFLQDRQKARTSTGLAGFFGAQARETRQIGAGHPADADGRHMPGAVEAFR